MRFFKDPKDFYSLDLKMRLYILGQNVEELMSVVKKHNAYFLILVTLTANITMLLGQMEEAEKTGNLLRKVYKKEISFLVNNSYEVIEKIIKSGDLDEFMKPEVLFNQ